MTLLVGALDVLDVRFGAAPVSKVLLGTIQVWPSGPLTPTGSLAIVEAADVAELVGTFTAGPVAGTIVATEPADVAVIVGTVTVGTVTGTIAATEVDDVAAIVGGYADAGSFLGAIAVTEVDDLAELVGTITAPVYTGTIAATEDEDVATIEADSTAPVYAGTIVATEDDDLATVVGTSSAPVYSGTIGVVEDDDTAALVGTSSVPVYTGVVAVTEDADVSALVGTFGPTGAVAVTEDADASTITGTFTAPTTVFADNFNRADSGSLGAEWAHDSGAWTIVSNQANRTNTGGDAAVFLHDIGSNDMWAEMVAVDGNSNYSLVHVRTTPAGRGVNLYGAFFIPDAVPYPTTLTPVIGKLVGGGYSDVATGTAISVTAPPKLRIEVQGTAIRFYVNDVLVLSTTDSSITTGTYAGMNNASTGTGAQNDSYRCGALPYTP